MNNKVLVIIVSILLVVAVGYTIMTKETEEKKENEVKQMVCSRDVEAEDIIINMNYIINYQNDYVKTVETTEKIESENQETLDFYKELVEDTYEPYKELEYYEYNVKVEGNTLTSIVEIDYEKIDYEKMIEIDELNGNLIKDGKVKLDDLKNSYTSMEFTCK